MNLTFLNEDNFERKYDNKKQQGEKEAFDYVISHHYRLLPINERYFLDGNTCDIRRIYYFHWKSMQIVDIRSENVCKTIIFPSVFS